jgi:hypothetical protein
MISAIPRRSTSAGTPRLANGYLLRPSDPAEHNALSSFRLWPIGEQASPAVRATMTDNICLRFVHLYTLGKEQEHRMNWLKWIVIIYIAVNIVLALVPGLAGQVQSASAHLGGNWAILLRFLFDPTEYVWKWIVELLVAVVALFRK